MSSENTKMISSYKHYEYQSKNIYLMFKFMLLLCFITVLGCVFCIAILFVKYREADKCVNLCKDLTSSHDQEVVDNETDNERPQREYTESPGTIITPKEVTTSMNIRAAADNQEVHTNIMASPFKGPPPVHGDKRSLVRPPPVHGYKGDKGDRGDRGYKGDLGPKGPIGEKGDTGSSGKDGAPGSRGLKGDTGEQYQISAAHYTTDTDDGTGNLTFTKPANWMTEHPHLILQLELKDGVFRAKTDGLYLLYCHVIFWDAKPKQSIAIYHNSEPVFRCVESIDSWEVRLGRDGNSKAKSCSVIGILYIKAEDTIEIKNMYSQTRFTLNPDGTYFGALLVTTR